MTKFTIQHDNRGSVEHGLNTEEIFKQLVIRKGGRVLEATQNDDIHRHIDKYIEFRNKKYSVDIKAVKKKQAGTGFEFQDTWLWVEFKNVLGSKGWLYGDMDLFAFERAHDFIICPSKDVRTLAEELVDFDAKVRRACWAEYNIYQRRGRKDQISMIRYDDLLKIKHHKIWKK